MFTPISPALKCGATVTASLRDASPTLSSAIIFRIMQGLGETAGLLTSVCWSFSSVAFTIAGRKIGSNALNHVRLWIATILLSIIHAFVFGAFFPVHAGS